MQRYDLDSVLRGTLIARSPMHCASFRRNGMIGRGAGHRIDFPQLRTRRVGGFRQLHDVVNAIDRNSGELWRGFFRMQREQHALLALHHHIALLLDHVIDIVRIEDHRGRLSTQFKLTRKTVIFLVIETVVFLGSAIAKIVPVVIVIDGHSQTVVVAVHEGFSEIVVAAHAWKRAGLIAVCVHVEQHVFDLVPLFAGKKGIDHVVRNVRVDVHLLPALAVGSLKLEQTLDLF